MALTRNEEIGRMSDASDEDATRMFSDHHLEHVKTVGRVADMHATSRACRTRGIWRMTRKTDKRAALPDTCDILVSCYEDVGRVRENATMMLRGNCSREISA